VSDVSAHRDVFADFIHACRNRTAPSCDGPGGRRSVALVEAIYKSARDGASVDVQEDGR